MEDKEIFHSFINEASFTCQMLSSGATQIRKAIYSKKGIYFQAFTNLTTGLERIYKLIFICDYIIKNKRQLPTSKYLKENLRHDLEKLHLICTKIKELNQFGFNFQNELNEEIYTRILYVLSCFAKGDRYSNIDFLTNDRNYIDPIVSWNANVDQYILEHFISNKLKEKIEANAQIVSKQMNDISAVYYQADTGNIVRNVYEASKMTSINNVVAPIRQLYVLKIIRFNVELLCAIEHKARDLGIIPYFGEIFARFINDDSFLKSQKDWEKFT